MKRLEQLSTTAIICLLILVVFLEEFIMLIIMLPPMYRKYLDNCYGRYNIMRLSAESNPYDNEADYFYGSDGTIYRYSFATGKTTTYHISEKAYIGEDFALVDDWVYYILSGTVRRLNYRTEEDEEVLSVEDIIRMCSKKEPSGYNDILLKRHKDCLVLLIDADVDGYEYVYICPVSGNMRSDCIDVNDLFPAENQSGIEEELIYKGICIKRYYDADMDYYKIIEVREEESGQTIFLDRKSIKVNEKIVSLWHEGFGGRFFYCIEGNSEEYEIDCLSAPVYAYSGIQSTKLATEGGEIIGLLHAVENGCNNPYYPAQKELKYDILFCLDPETGESSILYQTNDSDTRIIGYQDGILYLMKDHKVYSQTMGHWRKKLLFELPECRYYIFDWQGDYLVVRYGKQEPEYCSGYEELKTYKIK